MVNMHLSEIVLIDMSLDWSQIHYLAPTLVFVENLYLVRNNCSKICSEFSISKEHFKNLRYLNLEQNGIESWEEVAGFRVLNELQYLIVNKNKISSIHNRPGFRGLKSISFEDNLITDWKSFDQLNEFECRLSQIRCAGNPVMNQGET
jgi:Leucine-rich repeat (LRR) protein